jgi:hypothetical protein
MRFVDLLAAILRAVAFEARVLAVFTASPGDTKDAETLASARY